MMHEKSTGIILSIKPYAEWDRLILLFEAESGLMQLIAKGVRKSGSRRAPHLDILNYATIEVERSRSHLGYIREVSTLTAHRRIKGNPETYSAACLIGSFIIKMVPTSSPQPKLFEYTLEAFSALEKGVPVDEILLNYFTQSMRLLGYLDTGKDADKNRRRALATSLNYLDPGFILHARRTLGIFSK